VFIFGAMSKKSFYSSLSLLTVSLIIIAVVMNGRGEIGKFTDFSIYAILAFALLSISMYFFGIKAAGSKNKYTFNNLIIGNMILKMVLCLAIIMIYKEVYSLESRAFLIPFLIIYLSYTIFETYFLTRLAKN
jgi:heme/copper-type cytochrome/quinol oxidase subunit 4